MPSTDKTPTSTSKMRLDTLRTPRDLSLTRGGATKRKFAPVIPTSTNLSSSEPITSLDSTSELQQPQKKSQRLEDRRSQEFRGRDKGRHKKNLIQTTSTLEGLIQEYGLPADKSRSFPRGLPSDEQVVGTVKTNQDMEELLDDLEECVLKDEFFMMHIPENVERVPTMNPIAQPPQQKCINAGPKAISYDHLTEDKKGLHQENIYFVTLPDKLPGYSQKDKDAKKTTTSSTTASSSATTSTTASSSATTSATTTEEESEKNVGSLANHAEGFMGKLRFRKSGKVELVLGDNIMHGDGGKITTLKEATMLDTRMNPPEFINFGAIKHFINFRPDLVDTLLKHMQVNVNGHDNVRL